MKEEVLQPSSVRLKVETKERFREITEELGSNQQYAMEKLIEAFEFQKTKFALPERKEEISKFEAYTNTLIRMYTTALEESTDTRQLVRTEYDEQLGAKDQLITELHKRMQLAETEGKEAAEKLEQTLALLNQQNENYKCLKEELNNTIRELRQQEEDKEKIKLQYQEESDNLNKKVERLEKEQQSLNGKNYELKQECISLKEKITEFKTKNQRADDIIETLQMSLTKEEKKNKELQDSIKELKSSLKEKSDLAYAQAKKEMELELEKKLFVKEKEFSAEINHARDEYKKQVEEYQHKYLELVEKVLNTSSKKDTEQLKAKIPTKTE